MNQWTLMKRFKIQGEKLLGKKRWAPLARTTLRHW
jgi:hypothetical protein